jgi:hypothetical protein
VRALLPIACVAALTLAASAEARTSCAGVLVVDGVVLWGISIEGDPLPARGGARSAALQPACGEDDVDRRVAVTALAGIPARFAVVPVEDDGSVYLVEGSLVELAEHPLHETFYGDRGRPSLRRGGACRAGGTVRGTVTEPELSTRIALTGDRIVRVDARTRIANRPAYQPILRGQRLRVRTSQCGSRRVADRIAFVGATVQPERIALTSGDGDGVPVGFLVIGAIVLISVPLIVTGFRSG